MILAGSDDAVITRVKGYIASGTCNTVTFSETDCGDSATSYYREFVYNNKRVIISNNVRYIYSILLHNSFYLSDPGPSC